MREATVPRPDGQIELMPPGSDPRVHQAGIRFVEFFGLPGIGKTTASRLLTRKLCERGIRAADTRTTWEQGTLIERHAHRMRIVLSSLANRQFRRALVSIIRFVAESRQASPIDLLRVTWNLCAVAAYISRERHRRASIVVMDQGLLQGIWSVLLKSTHKKTSQTWLDVLGDIGVHDVVFVHLHGPAGVTRDRLLQRGDRSSRMQRVSDVENSRLWSAADEACRMIATGLSRVTSASSKPLAVVDLESAATPDEVAERALAAIVSVERDTDRGFALKGDRTCQ